MMQNLYFKVFKFYKTQKTTRCPEILIKIFIYIISKTFIKKIKATIIIWSPDLT